MCGLELVLWAAATPFVQWQEASGMDQMLCRRGPDSQSTSRFVVGAQEGFISSSVLHLRGKEVTPQPLCAVPMVASDGVPFVDGDFLSWNGEIFSGSVQVEEHENDGVALFLALQQRGDRSIPDVLSSIHGPFAFCYWESQSHTLWFGRDPLGRRSLLLHRRSADALDGGEPDLILTSSSTAVLQQRYGTDQWAEVPCEYLNSVQLPLADLSQEDQSIELNGDAEDINERVWKRMGEGMQQHEWKMSSSCTLPPREWTVASNGDSKEFTLKVPAMFLPYGTRNESLITEPEAHLEEQFQAAKDLFLSHLDESVRRRVTGIPPSSEGARVAVMYSGGIDSTLLAALATRHVPSGEPIDLLNVAFGKWPFNVPDRKTGRQGLEELRLLDPKRVWNFVEINVSKEELEEQQEDLISHAFPRTTVMDMTIGPALYFGARGKGVMLMEGMDPSHLESYVPFQSKCRVLLLGNGADEQLGGYGRHRTAHKHRCASGLQLELNKDTSRLWIRNFGRDDRIISSLSKESRYPFLDRDFMQFLNETPLGLICDFRLPPGSGDKRILREAAKCVGLRESCCFPKRAIQFGSRISHLTERKKGGHIHFQGFVGDKS